MDVRHFSLFTNNRNLHLNYTIDSSQTDLLCSVSKCDPNSLLNEVCPFYFNQQSVVPIFNSRTREDGQIWVWKLVKNHLTNILKNVCVEQVSRASLTPETSFIARPASSWLDDFLVWISPDSYRCCRKFPDGSYCPSDEKVGLLN